MLCPQLGASILARSRHFVAALLGATVALLSTGSPNGYGQEAGSTRAAAEILLQRELLQGVPGVAGGDMSDRYGGDVLLKKYASPPVLKARPARSEVRRASYEEEASSPAGDSWAEGAADAFENPDVRGTAEDPDRRWNFTFINGYEYDTNVALSPLITGLGNFGSLRDSRWVFSTFGEYRLIQEENLVLGLIGSTFHSVQFRLDRYNIQDYMGGTYLNAGFGRSILGARYEFHETLLDQKQFAQSHRLTPNYTFREGDFGHLTAYYEFERLDVKGFELIPAQIRSGNVHAVGTTQAVYLLEGQGRLFFGYRYEQAFTTGSDFDRKTNMVTARLEIPLPGELVYDAEYRHFWDDYENANSLDFFNRPRADRRAEIRTGLQKFLTPHLSMRLDYTYINNDSSVVNLFGSSFYSYDRHVLSTVLIYDF